MIFKIDLYESSKREWTLNRKCTLTKLVRKCKSRKCNFEQTVLRKSRSFTALLFECYSDFHTRLGLTTKGSYSVLNILHILFDIHLRPQEEKLIIVRILHSSLKEYKNMNKLNLYSLTCDVRRIESYICE